VLSTEEGRLLGTPTYMAPEQARGRPIDRRVDVWAFGCVLYECLVARRAFAGETLTDVLTAVIEREPDWTQLPAATPPRVRSLVLRCLVKDAKLRLQAIGEERILLAEADGRSDPEHGGAARSHAGSSRRGWLPWIAGAAIALVGATSPWWSPDLGRRTAAPRSSAATVRFTIAPPPGFGLTANLVRRASLVVSPAGDRIAFAAEKDERSHLCVRDVGSLTARVLPHTEGCSNFCFSPDGKWIAFLADSRLQKMPADGGPPVSLCDTAVGGGRMAWMGSGWSGTAACSSYPPTGRWVLKRRS
jgi:serine/threonine-protein kinase